MPRHPLEIFGLSPELVGELSEKDLFSVLKSMYRALLKTVHPDVAAPGKKGHEKIVELNLAFEALNLDKNQESFRALRKSYLARRPKVAYRKSQLLEKELARQALREDLWAESYLERLLADSGWAGPETAERRPGARPFPLSKIRVGLLDVAINQNLKMAAWTLGSNYKQMEFDAKGQMSVKPVGRRRFAKAGYIYLLGSVPMEDLELAPLLERPPARFFKNPALNARIGASSPSFSVLNRIGRDKFKSHVLIKLKPMIMERAWLFSLSRPDFEENGSITLEGQVIKIEDLS